MAIEPLIIDANYPEILADIARTVHEELLTTPGLNVSYQRAGEIALVVTERVRAKNGGVPLYVPKGVTYMASLRDKQMYAEFNGTNYDKLAHDYGLTSMRVRQIVDEMAKAERKARQKSLFPES